MGRREAAGRGAMASSHHSELCSLQDEASGGADKRQRKADVRAAPEVKKHQHKHNLKHRYEVMETLGKGTYGKVKRAVERASLKTVSGGDPGCFLLFFFVLIVLDVRKEKTKV